MEALRHSSHDKACAVCAENSTERPMTHGILYEDELWVVRHAEPPYGVAGWLTLQARRHVPGPHAFTDDEARSFGPALRHVSAVLLEASGALRVYVAALGEMYPHFHCHLVPRYGEGADALPHPPAPPAKGWALFGQAGEAAAGRVSVDEEVVVRLVASVKAALAAAPLPGGSGGAWTARTTESRRA